LYRLDLAINVCDRRDSIELYDSLSEFRRDILYSYQGKISDQIFFGYHLTVLRAFGG